MNGTNKRRSNKTTNFMKCNLKEALERISILVAPLKAQIFSWPVA